MKHRFLYFCSVWPEWTSSAAGLRSMHMIQMALDSEWEVFVVAPSEKNKFSETIESLGVKVAPVYPNDPALEQVLAEFNPTIVMYDRFISEEKFSFRVREVTPRALQVIETQDFHWLRKIRIQNHHTHQEVIQFPEKEIANQTLDDHACREISSYYRVDFIVVCSLYEKKILLDNFQFPEERIFYVPLLYHQKKCPKKLKGTQREKILFPLGTLGISRIKMR